MKRLTFLLAALFCCIVTFAASGKCGANLKWKYDSKSQTLTITGNGAMNRYYYKYIGNNKKYTRPWNRYSDKIQKIKIEEGVTSIGRYAFAECKNISTCELPSSLCVIESYAFYFARLPEVSIPNGVQMLAEHAFTGCPLQSIYIPASVTTIGELCFNYNSKLKTINVASDNPKYCAKDNILYDKQQTTLILYPEGKLDRSYTIPSTVKYIEREAFNRAVFSSVTIPYGVKTIRQRAFQNCKNLTSITIPSSVSEIEEYAFYSCKNLASKSVPSSVNVHSKAFVDCPKLNSSSSYASSSSSSSSSSSTRTTQQTNGQTRANVAIAVLQGLADGFNAASSSSSSTTNTYNNYNSSSNTSSSNNAGVLVGNYTAFGLSKSFGNTVTHSQTFTVYKDSRGYYIIDPKWKTNNYLRTNTDRTYFDYPVGAYNYRTLTSLSTDVHWFFKL